MKLPPLPQVPALRAMFPPPSWVRGAISIDDAEFIHHFVRITVPRIVAEVGVGPGVSSAAVLHALDRLPEVASGRALHSCDVGRTCYFNASRATGQAAREMYPSAKANWFLDTDTDARRLAQRLSPGSVDLTFIDANHHHPWPLLDVLHMTALAKPRSWIVLHDVVLPRVHPEVQSHGAMWLFEEWPFETMQPTSGATNTGAIRLPANPADIVPVALSLLGRPWEAAPAPSQIGLQPDLEDIQAAFLERLGLSAAADISQTVRGTR